MQRVSACGEVRSGQVDEIVGDDVVHAGVHASECGGMLFAVDGQQRPTESVRLTPPSYGVDGSPVIEIVSLGSVQ